MDSEQRTRPNTERLVLISFFMSGFAALVYEVSWLRLTGLYFESTAYSAATVVAIFMGGLALGSYLSGRIARRSRDLLLLYFNLEALIGLIALLVPLLFTSVRPLFGVVYRNTYDYQFAYHTLRILLSALLMLLPTVLMGMTLPILIEAITRRYSSLSRKAGLLYGVNSAGAALGAAAAGFMLLPRLGTGRATLVGVVINLSIAFAGWVALGRFPWFAVAAEKETGRPGSSVGLAPRKYILIAVAVSGFCALCYEIIWTRLLIANIGPASSSFATVLSCFIVGLAAGSTLYAAVSPRIKGKVFSCGVLIILTGLAALLASIFLPGLPQFASKLLSDSQGNPNAVAMVKYAVAGMLILPLTIFSGALFPAAASAYVPDRSRLSERVGRLYAGNCVGSIAGSLIAGFIMLPLLGAHRAALPVIIIQLAVGFYIAGRSRGLKAVAYFAPVPLAAVLILVTRTPADPRLLYGGGYLYFWQYEDVTGRPVAAETRSLLYHRDGPGGTVTVSRSPDRSATYLAIDGKTDGSDTAPDMMTQSMLAHLPLVLHGHPRTVLVIGLGTGTTYATALTHPVEKVECVEISPQVIEASKFFYTPYDSTRMRDPRGEVILGDGRSLVFFTDDEYDVIIAEPSNPWLSGMGNLFTIEYFNAMRRRLREGGVCCQWLHGYRLGPRTFKSIVKTFATVFPHASLWWINITGGDYLLIGSSHQPVVSIAALDSAISAYGIKNYMHPEGTMSAYSFLRRFVAADRDLRRFAAKGRLVTDDSAFLEYSASQEMYAQVLDILHRELSVISRPGLEFLDSRDKRDPAVRSRLEFYKDNERAFIEFIYSDSAADPWDHPVYRAKRNDWKRDEDISVAVGQSMTGYAEQLYVDAQNVPSGEERRAKIRNILRGYTDAMSFTPPRDIDVENLAVLYYDIGEYGAALGTLEAGLELGYETAGIHKVKGEVLYALAAEELAQAQEADAPSPSGADSHAAAAADYLRRASVAFRRAAELKPMDVSAWLSLGAVMRAMGDYHGARACWQRVLAIDPNNDNARRALAAFGDR